MISVRRGDFVYHPYYYQLSYKYYRLAIIENFPDWKQRNLIFTSDDIDYCKYHFSSLPNSYFLENFSAIEQLALGSQCNDFVISNSTFSWWIAWLGEKSSSKIIRPQYNFNPSIKDINLEKDFFPERWIRFNHHYFGFPKEFIEIFLRGSVYAIKTRMTFLLKQTRQKLKKKGKKLIHIFSSTKS